jgi:RNA polymerase sigma-70 factor (ECF subfamily)
MSADFDEFFAANYGSLVRSLSVTTGNEELAVDAVQEAFVKAFARWRTVSQLDVPVAWVHRVAINASRDLMRSESRRRRRELREGVMAVQEAEQPTDVKYLRELLSSLPPQQRLAITMFYVDDRSISHIAGTLGISEGAVKFHLSRGREKLRGVVEGTGHDVVG